MLAGTGSKPWILSGPVFDVAECWIESDHRFGTLSRAFPLSFKPFAVQCLTCASQLRVSDAAIVGTIAACPKCGSMVEIKRPESQVEIGRSGVDSQAITEEAIAAEPGLATGAIPPTAEEGFAGSGSVLPESGDGLSGAMHPDWQSAKTQKSRQIALVVALSATGLIAAVMFFGWFVSSWGGKQTTTVEAQSNDAGDASSGDSDQTSQPQGRAGTDQVNEDPLSVDTASSQDQTPSTDPNEVNLNESTGPDRGHQPSEVNGLNEVASTPDSPPATTSDVTPSNAETGNGATGQPIPGDLLPPSVLGPPDNSEASVSTDDSADVDSATAKDTEEPDLGPGMQELPPELAQYTQFLLEDGAQAKPTLQAPPTMEEVKLEAAAVEEDEDLRIQIVPKELDLRADLAIRLALASDGYPATDLMLLVSQVTGVPIQMDWPSFDLAGADIQQQVPTAKEWRSARELLEEAADVLKAEIREQPTLLLITPRDDVFDESVGRLKSVDDFGAGSASAEKFLTQFAAGDNADVNPREASQMVCFATEALRRMRGIPPQMEDARFGRWATEVNDPQTEWTVLAGGDFGPQLDAPMSVAGLLRRAAKRNQATCVFNWQDAVRRGAPPEHLLMPHTEVDAGTTLRNTLSPMGLQVREVDSKHWWVGTEATYDRLPIFVWTPPLGPARADFVERIKKVMAGSSPLKYRLAIDETSDRALMLLPRFIVRQLPTIIPTLAAK